MGLILYLFSLLPFYLLGAFPTGYLLARYHGINIEEVGSGNVGATNVGRALGKHYGYLTLAVDALKGALACWAAALLSGSEGYTVAAGAAAVTGHCFSIPGKLRGGKGVATALGVLLAFQPILAAGALVTFIIVFSISEIVAVASVAATMITPVVALFTGAREDVFIPLMVMAFIIVFRHRHNLERLAKGIEGTSKDSIDKEL